MKIPALLKGMPRFKTSLDETRYFGTPRCLTPNIVLVHTHMINLAAYRRQLDLARRLMQQPFNFLAIGKHNRHNCKSESRFGDKQLN
jgi:hypothetical protein